MDILEHCELTPIGERQIGLNAFDASVILGKNNHKSNLELWAEKTGKIKYDGPKFTQSSAILKSGVAQSYAEQRNAAVFRVSRTVRATSFDFMIYRIEYVVCNTPESKGTVTDWTDSDSLPPNIESILDVRAVGMNGPASTIDWEDDGIPAKYEAQGLHAYQVTGVNRITYAALISGQGLVVRTRLYEEDDLQDLVMAEFGFWENVETKTEPEITEADESTTRALRKMFPVQVEGKSVTLEGEDADKYRQWLNAKELSDASGKTADLLRAQLELVVGDAESVIVDGKVVVTYKKSKDGSKFDPAAFAEAHPDLYAKFTVPTTGSRSWVRKK